VIYTTRSPGAPRHRHRVLKEGMMRRPRSSLVAALLGACLILGACNQGGSAASAAWPRPVA